MKQPKLSTPPVGGDSPVEIPKWAVGLCVSPRVAADWTGVPIGTIEDLAQRRLIQTELRQGQWYVRVDHLLEAARREAT